MQQAGCFIIEIAFSTTCPLNWYRDRARKSRPHNYFKEISTGRSISCGRLEVHVGSNASVFSLSLFLSFPSLFSLSLSLPLTLTNFISLSLSSCITCFSLYLALLSSSNYLIFTLHSPSLFRMSFFPFCLCSGSYIFSLVSVHTVVCSLFVICSTIVWYCQ